jgi:hypothetical protein
MKTITNRHRPHKRRCTTYSDSVAVYDGRRYLGIILPYGNDAFRAIDFEDRVVGDFASQREAAIAIMRGVR